MKKSRHSEEKALHPFFEITALSKGTGQVQDISSDGLAFRAEGPREPEMWLRVSMAWPAKPDSETMVRLVFEGTVLRTRGTW